MYHSLCETDVFVVGGGPAGLAAAIAARQEGFSVTVADAAIPPIDKTCGEGIMPDGLAALWKLGISPAAVGGFPFSGIRFSDANSAVSANFPQRCGLGIRRVRLHQLMVDRAAELGVRMHWGARITGIHQHGVSIHGRSVRCPWLVGADGHNSRVRYWSGLDQTRKRKRRFGFRRHYQITPWSEFVEVYWTDRGQLYVTPVADDQVCVALITHHNGVRLENALAVCPELACRLGNSRQITREQGAISASCALRRVHAGSRILVGEASGSVDAITGEGLSMAFQQAHALAAALKCGRIEDYATAHRHIAKTPQLTGQLMLFMDRNHSLRRRALRALAAEPSLFARLLAVHIGDVRPVQFGVQETLSLGWRLITA